MSADERYLRVVSGAWGLSRRPRLYTPTGSLTEVVAYLAGMLDTLGPSFGDPAPLGATEQFAAWLTARHGGGDPGVLSNAARICECLSNAFSDPIDALWREFEVFADELLGVPKGTFPIDLPSGGYGLARPPRRTTTKKKKSTPRKQLPPGRRR